MAYRTYDKDSDIEDINSILITEPEIHRFIFIKEKLRCAKTLNKAHLGVVYERYTKSPNDAVVIQGLIGRGTGYDDNGESIYYTNIPSIEKYKKLWDSNFEDKTVKWNSKTTKMENNLLISSGTYTSPDLIDGIGVVINESKEESKEDCESPKPIIKMNSFQDIKEWFKQNLDLQYYGRGPNTKGREPNDDGFCECITQFDKTKRARHKNEFEKMEEENRWGFRGTQKSRDKNKYRVYCCYSDLLDNTTLEWWLIYY